MTSATLVKAAVKAPAASAWHLHAQQLQGLYQSEVKLFTEHHAIASGKLSVAEAHEAELRAIVDYLQSYLDDLVSTHMGCLHGCELILI